MVLVHTSILTNGMLTCIMVLKRGGKDKGGVEETKRMSTRRPGLAIRLDPDSVLVKNGTRTSQQFHDS